MSELIVPKKIQTILEAAINAPSGDNVQPWKFELLENRLLIHNDASVDQSLYNYKQVASLIAHGCLIENIVILAESAGLKIDIQLFPYKNNESIVAEIIFSEGISKSKNSLVDQISKRVTNRKAYKKKSIGNNVIVELRSIISHTSEVSIDIVQGQEEIKTLSKILSLNEKILLVTRSLHHFLFSHINWNENEENIKRSGMLIDTMELKGPKRKIFQLASNWRTMNILQKVGLPSIVAKDNARTYASSSAMSLISLNEITPREMVNGGRIVQRFWLTATKHGLSLQPLTGIIFLAKRVWENDTADLSSTNVILIEEAHNRICRMFKITQRHPIMLFRMGFSDKPSAISKKRSLEKLFLKNLA